MSRNGAGVYSLPAPPSPFVDGQKASATDMMTVLNDIATAMTGSIAADGQTPITGTLDFDGNDANDIGAATAATLVTSKSAAIGTTLTVTGATTLSDTLSVGGSATFSASAKFGAAVSTLSSLSVGTTLGVTGATTLSSTLKVTGATTLSSTLDVTGAATAANGTTGSQVVNFSQFPATLAATGTETMPSGRILKWGTWTTTNGVGSVSFAVAFPTAIFGAPQLQISGASGGAVTLSPVAVGLETVSGFNVRGNSAESLTGTWWAIGY